MPKVTIERPSGEIHVFDAWLTGSFGGSAVVTDHPIEDGSSVADHSQADPRTITLSLRQTETPLEGATAEGPYGPERIRETMAFLDAAGRSGDPLEVSIPRVGLFEQMVLQSWPNDLTSAKRSDFEVVFKQIETAEAIVTAVPVEAIAPPARSGQQEPADVGKQATEEEDTADIVGPLPEDGGPADPDVDQSLALDGIDALKGAFGG